MHKVSAKRQVTIPKELCDRAGIQPGDMVEIFELKHLKGDTSVTDEESLQDTLEHKHTRKRKRRTA